MLFASFRKLHRSGILGMNRRLGEFILPHNPRAHYPLVDDKIETARLAADNQIPSPDIYFSISRYGDLKKLPQILLQIESFVIKPARGSQGNGILVVHGVQESADGSHYYHTSKGPRTIQALTYHISGILSGLYSLNSMVDKAIIQQKLENHPLFASICPSGIPDIRVIIFRGYPVMAMVRLPTRASSGRANLHQGAVGCGIRIGDGMVTKAVHQNRIVQLHPDSDTQLEGLLIPHWDEVLTTAARCYDITKLGYLGIDIVLDPVRGPLLLEMNARPGLSIQTANLAGLTPRLKAVASLADGKTAEERVAMAKELFN